MPLLLDCPACQRKLRVPDHLLGQTVKCPTCGEMFTATGEPTASIEPPTATGAMYEPPQDRPPPRPARRESEHRDDDSYDDPSYADRPYQRRMDLTPHRGTMILVFGILSIVSVIFCPLGIFGPIAWVMGQNDLREMRAGNMDRSGEDNTSAGRICGIIGTVVLCLYVVGCVAYIALVGAIVGGMRRF